MTDDTKTILDALRVLARCGRAHLQLVEDPSEVTEEQIDEALDCLFGLGVVDSMTIHGTRREVQAMSADPPVELTTKDGRDFNWAVISHPGRLDLFWNRDTTEEETP